MLYCIKIYIKPMKVQLSQIEDFESAPSRMKIQWKERKNGRRQELVNGYSRVVSDFPVCALHDVQHLLKQLHIKKTWVL